MELNAEISNIINSIKETRGDFVDTEGNFLDEEGRIIDEDGSVIKTLEEYIDLKVSQEEDEYKEDISQPDESIVNKYKATFEELGIPYDDLKTEQDFIDTLNEYTKIAIISNRIMYSEPTAYVKPVVNSRGFRFPVTTELASVIY